MIHKSKVLKSNSKSEYMQCTREHSRELQATGLSLAKACLLPPFGEWSSKQNILISNSAIQTKQILRHITQNYILLIFIMKYYHTSQIRKLLINLQWRTVFKSEHFAYLYSHLYTKICDFVLWWSVVNFHWKCPLTTSEGWFWVPVTWRFSSIFLLMCHGDRHAKIRAQVLGLLLPVKFRLLAYVCLSPGCCRHLRNEPAHGRYSSRPLLILLSFCHSILPFKQNNLY